MELYNNNSSYLQDFSNQDHGLATDKKKTRENKSTKPVSDHIGDSVHNQDTTESENVGDQILSENKDESNSPENNQSKKPEGTNDGMNFANRYK